MAKEKKKQDPGAMSEGGGFDMTPMIDVTFLLIIFFMIVTDISNRKPLVELPIAQKAEKDMNEDRGRLVINILEDGTIETQDGPQTPERLARLLAAEAAVTKGADGFPTRVIMIRADKRAKYKAVQGIMAACMKVKLWRIAFSTKDVSKK